MVRPMRMDDWTPWIARLMLLAVLGAMALLLSRAFGGASVLPPPPAGMGDMELYALTVAKLRSGMDYYQALGTSLVEGGFPTASVLNWRPPFYLTLLALAPSTAIARVALCLLALAAAGLAALFVARGGGMRSGVGAFVLAALALIGVVAEPALYSFELTAGMLILAGFSAHGLGWRWAGLLALIAALFVRELAVVPVAVMLCFAIASRRLREVGLLAAGLLAYAVFFAWHAQMVALAVGMQGVAGPSWLYFGGAGFILMTAGFNGVFMLAPIWLSAAVLPLGILGLVHWRAGAPMLATVALYLAIFAVGGRPFNAYWGALYMPMVTVGLAFAPSALTALWRAVRSPRSS